MAGPFSKADLMELWRSSMDEGYTQPLLENPNSGIELVEQAAEQFAAASAAVDRSLQSFFLKPWSGQSAPPASGADFSMVEVRVERLSDWERAVVLLPGQAFFEEEAIDYGPDGGIVVGTGRRYTPVDPATLVPGEAAITVPSTAERTGFGYDLPPAGSLTRLDSPASGQRGIHATIVPGPTGNRLIFDRGDVVPPNAVGQYVQLTFGANAGQRRRVVSFQGPAGDSPLGSLTLDAMGVASAAGIGTFLSGEEIVGQTSGARAIVRAARNGWLVYEAVEGTLITELVLGVVTGAPATILAINQQPAMTAETGAAAWKLLTWDEVGLAPTNDDAPSGGKSPELDMIGDERNIGRAPGEADEQYRNRIDQLPDVVAPNALLRAANRVLSQYGAEARLREVGEIDGPFPGFFYDTTDGSGPAAYAYDFDFSAHPRERFKLYVNFTEMRAFFLIGVPRLGLGEFGFGYDAGGLPFYDSAPFVTFYDGFALTASVIYRAVWDAVNKARGGGVGFDLVLDVGPA